MRVVNDCYRRDDFLNSLRNCGLAELCLLSSESPKYHFYDDGGNVFCPYERNQVADENRRRQCFVAADRLREIVQNLDDMSISTIGDEDETHRITEELKGAFDRLIEKNWPPCDCGGNGVVRALWSLASQLFSDLQEGTWPPMLAALMFAALASRSQAAIGGSVEFLDEELQNKAFEIVRRCFNEKYEGRESGYWSILMFYSIVIDIIIRR